MKKPVKNPLPVAMPVQSPKVESAADEARKWKTEDALRDIERAEAHKRDKSLMRDVKKLAKEKMNNLNKIC